MYTVLFTFSMDAMTVMDKKRLVGALSGLCIVGVTFGMARYGYGLFLPQISAAFSLGKEMQGFLGSALYAGYLLATVISAWLSGYKGPRYPLTLGFFCASAGTAIVALSSTPNELLMGILLCGASPGMVFPALSDWVSIEAERTTRNHMFAIMNSGTGLGVIFAAPLDWIASSHWRDAWLFFSLCSLVAGVFAVANAPSKDKCGISPSDKNQRFDFKTLFKSQVYPLYFVSVISGFVTSIYWTYSVDLIVNSKSGILPGDKPELVFWMIVGIAGFVGALTGGIINKNGLKNVLTLTMTSISLALLLLSTEAANFVTVLISGGIFGAGFIFITGLLGVWSMVLFVKRPSIGFGFTFLLFTAGAMLGPYAAGIIASKMSQVLAFKIAALLSLFACILIKKTY